ncbi:MAG: hypothetical protein RLZZ399_2202, partial [Verrucomicrobiota bacterium]
MSTPVVFPQSGEKLVCSLAVLLWLPAAAALGDAPKISFNRDIRPILSDNCFSCHGPDKGHRKGGLRLDSREEAQKPGKSGEIALKPGDAEGSELIKRVFSGDADELMPPPESHKKLTPAQRETLRRWVMQGGEYEPHWAYIPPVRRPYPAHKNSALVRNPIDAFIQEKLETHGIRPSREADRGALLRRLSLDLTGLPPTADELLAFERDVDNNAYSRQVDRLLSSPHYGERMASHWLDVARYADTVGFHGDQNMNVWAYRDWVVSSFNANQPFDQFTIEQLAGDLLPNPTPAQLTATCFNRLNMVTREGGAQAKEYLAKYTADRVRTVGTAWLGSTFACAECHDHKFDPIATRDFYSLGAFFADIKQWGVYAQYGYIQEPELVGVNNDHPFPPEITVESPALLKRMAFLENQMLEEAKQAPVSEAVLEPWRREVTAFLKMAPEGWQRLEGSVETEAAGSEAAGKAAAKPVKMKLGLRPSEGWVASVVLNLEADPAHRGMITLSGKDTTVRTSFRMIRGGKPQPIKIRHAVADRWKPSFSNGFEVIGVQNAWRTLGPDQPHQAVFILDTPLRFAAGDVLEVTLETGDSKAVSMDLCKVSAGVSPLIPEHLSRTRFPEALPSSREGLRLAYLRSTGIAPDFFSRVKVLERSWLECRDGKTPVLVTKAVENPLTVRVLPRGNWMDETGTVVSPETPGFLPALFGNGERKSRLDLARWLVSDVNPLTARVVMNRLWRQFFGAGLSAQTDELGSQGEPPSHPELLDWLAVEFREKGWDVKHMVRLIVSSHTYRQSAQLRSELREIDPANRLLASQNPRRLEAEAVRDNALAIAGLLNRDLGGPPAKPYQPAGYYQALQFPGRDYV